MGKRQLEGNGETMTEFFDDAVEDAGIVAFDFDGTLARGNMQETSFIPSLVERMAVVSNLESVAAMHALGGLQQRVKRRTGFQQTRQAQQHIGAVDITHGAVSHMAMGFGYIKQKDGEFGNCHR